MGYSPALEELMERRAISPPQDSQPEISTGVSIYTDGSILRNPGGEGGWAMVVTEGSAILEVRSGGVPESTNNRMELTGVLEALRWAILDLRPGIEIVTDSQYVQKGLTEYLEAWKRRKWKKVKNPDLWQAMAAIYHPELVTVRWIKGHKGHRFNELADELAGVAARLVRDRV